MAMRPIETRHLHRHCDATKQSTVQSMAFLDCFVAPLLAKTRGEPYFFVYR
jgi:hypothetical protein